MSFFHQFDRMMGRVYHHIGTLVGVTIGLFAVSISLDLVLRLLKLGNLPGYQEIIEYFLFAGVFLSAPWALRLGAHVRVELLMSWLSRGPAQALGVLLDLIGLTICLVLIWFGSINLSHAYAFKSMQMKYFNVPEWWLLAVFVTSFSLLALEFLCRLVRGQKDADSEADTVGGV